MCVCTLVAQLFPANRLQMLIRLVSTIVSKLRCQFTQIDILLLRGEIPHILRALKARADNMLCLFTKYIELFRLSMCDYYIDSALNSSFIHCSILEWALYIFSYFSFTVHSFEVASQTREPSEAKDYPRMPARRS